MRTAWWEPGYPLSSPAGPTIPVMPRRSLPPRSRSAASGRGTASVAAPLRLLTTFGTTRTRAPNSSSC
eukprot:scaffold20335_cov63-Phaeocystis_antarctica.AAC.1